jgi:hypothetical protein
VLVYPDLCVYSYILTLFHLQCARRCIQLGRLGQFQISLHLVHRTSTGISHLRVVATRHVAVGHDASLHRQGAWGLRDFHADAESAGTPSQPVLPERDGRGPGHECAAVVSTGVESAGTPTPTPALPMIRKCRQLVESARSLGLLSPDAAPALPPSHSSCHWEAVSLSHRRPLAGHRVRVCGRDHHLPALPARWASGPPGQTELIRGRAQRRVVEARKRASAPTVTGALVQVHCNDCTLMQ